MFFFSHPHPAAPLVPSLSASLSCRVLTPSQHGTGQRGRHHTPPRRRCRCVSRCSHTATAGTSGPNANANEPVRRPAYPGGTACEKRACSSHRELTGSRLEQPRLPLVEALRYINHTKRRAKYVGGGCARRRGIGRGGDRCASIWVNCEAFRSFQENKRGLRPRTRAPSRARDESRDFCSSLPKPQA